MSPTPKKNAGKSAGARKGAPKGDSGGAHAAKAAATRKPKASKPAKVQKEPKAPKPTKAAGAKGRGDDAAGTKLQVRVYKDGHVQGKELAEHPFGERVLHRTLKDSVLSYGANQRLGCASTRGRDTVAGSNKKPWKQKHTGRARAGDRKSPIWRGGGVVFGPKPRDYSYHLPAKERRVALRTALLGKLQDGEVVLARMAGFDAPSAKSARKILADLGAPRRALVVLGAPNENAWKSFRNFPGVTVRVAVDLCAYDVVAGGLVICEPDAFEALGTRVGLVGQEAAGVKTGAEA
jgi:large subunit ribosomal protein L4